MKSNINHLGQIIALLSFVTGTTFLALYLYFGEAVVNVFYGLVFVIVSVIVNTVVFMFVLGSASLYKTHRKEGLITCLVMLLNIPIALLYFFMVITLSNFNL